MDVFSALFYNFFRNILQVVASLEGGKFNKHGKVDSGNDFDSVILNEAETEI